MERTRDEKNWALLLKKEQELIKREDKQENVDRIAKAQQYKRDAIMEKIQFDSLKSKQVQQEKEKLASMRF